MISVLVPTFNEQCDLAECLASVSWSNDVHVFDSFSTDSTVEIARGLGAQVTQRRFDGYASQKNAALQTLPFANEWVLLLDADERVPEQLRNELVEFVSNVNDDIVVGRICRRDYLDGRWLKHSQISSRYMRLVRPRQVHFEREVNEVLVPNGKVADLVCHIVHYPFSKGMSHWLSKHNRYSSLEAERALVERRLSTFSVWLALFGRDVTVRRFNQKGLFYKLPFRPLVKFAYMYFIRRGALDGRAGLKYCLLQAIYEYFIILKEREIRINN